MSRRSLLIVVVTALLASLALAPSMQAQDGEDRVENPDAIVYVDGLACPFCAYGLEKKITELDAIQKLEVHLDESRVLLAFKDGQSLTEKQIQRAVKKAGFTARKIELLGEAPAETLSL